MNNCKIEECMDLCSGCKDEIDCKWLVPPKMVKPVQKVDPEKQDKCQFNPFGKNITHCTNVCNSNEKVNWGGDLCTEKSCNLLCSGCETVYPEINRQYYIGKDRMMVVYLLRSM